MNWWSRDTAPARLAALADHLVEVHCDCPVEVAASRFADRRRHPGHHDPVRGPEERGRDVERVRAAYAGPIGVGPGAIHVDTSTRLDGEAVDCLVRRVRRALSVPAGDLGAN